jgi:predicted ATPase
MSINEHYRPNYIVLTGAPGGGKTTLIRKLREAGYLCVDEPARQVLAEQRDLTLDKTFNKFTGLLLDKSIENFEKFKDVEHPVIFDRGVPDAAGYALHFGLDTTHYEQAAKIYRYNPSIFVFPPWKEIYTTDDERRLTFEQTLPFHEELLTPYRRLGYTLIPVPLTSVEERFHFIVEGIQPFLG